MSAHEEEDRKSTQPSHEYLHQGNRMSLVDIEMVVVKKLNPKYEKEKQKTMKKRCWK